MLLSFGIDDLDGTVLTPPKFIRWRDGGTASCDTKGIVELIKQVNRPD
jgi:hypothetical protein